MTHDDTSHDARHAGALTGPDRIALRFANVVGVDRDALGDDALSLIVGWHSRGHIDALDGLDASCAGTRADARRSVLRWYGTAVCHRIGTGLPGRRGDRAGAGAAAPGGGARRADAPALTVQVQPDLIAFGWSS